MARSDRLKEIAELQATIHRALRGDEPDQFDAIPWVEQKLGFTLAPWQRDFLTNIQTKKRVALLSPRQAGKSITVAGAACVYLKQHPQHTVAIVSPTSRQSSLLHNKIRHMLQDELERESQTVLALSNGAQCLALPGDRPAVVRGTTANLLLIDEIAFIKTSLFEAVAPTVAGVGGSIVALSTPNGASGVFHEIWTSPDEDGWHKVRVTLEDCLHYQEEDIAAQRARLGERRFAQEFGGEFLQPAGAVFQDLDDLFGAFTAVESEVERDNFMPLSGFH